MCRDDRNSQVIQHRYSQLVTYLVFKSVQRGLTLVSLFCTRCMVHSDALPMRETYGSKTLKLSLMAIIIISVSLFTSKIVKWVHLHKLSSKVIR